MTTLTAEPRRISETELITLPGPAYTRNHQLIPLYTVTSDSLDSFHDESGRAFSRLKYGEAKSIEHFAKRIADQIMERFGERLRAHPEDFVVCAPAYKFAPTSAVLLSEAVQRELSERTGADVEQIYMSRRKTAAGDFGKLKTKAAREAQINGNFYYDGPPLEGRTVLFVEDALVSGTHYVETLRALVQDGEADLNDIYGSFIVDVHAETFGDRKFAVEDILNHIWVNRKNVDRLVEIMQQPDSQYTPRVLKMLFQNHDWPEMLAALDQLDHQTVCKVLYAARADGMEEKEEFKETIDRIKQYSDNRLSRVKGNLGLRSCYTLHDDTIEAFLNQPYVVHPGFPEGVSRGGLYSLLKFGDPIAIETFARELAGAIKAEFGAQIEANPSAFGIAAPGYAHAPGSARVLAARVAELLHLPVTEVNRTDVPEVSYGKIGDPRRRFAEVAAGEYEVSGTVRQNLFVIEDAVVSGANTARLCDVLKTHGVKTIPFALVDMATSDLAAEEKLNAGIINANNLPLLTTILNDPRSPLVMRTLKTVLGLPQEKLVSLLAQTDLDRVIEMHNVARRNGLSDKGAFKEGLAELSRSLSERMHVIRNGRLLPYHACCVVTDRNAEGILKNEGVQYSLMKYGDRQAIDQAAAALMRQIKETLGAEIRKHPEQFVVASTHYFRVSNAASHLGAQVAKGLGLPLADIRRKEIYQGEFGDLKEVSDRESAIRGNAYCANPHVIEGKRVIYIDDAFVSGTHLKEHVAALGAAGASDIQPFALLDVVSRDLSLEKKLNCAVVGPDRPEALARILQDEKSPLLTRAMKMLLKLPSDRFEQIVAALPDERVYDICEAAEIEGYDRTPSMQANFKTLADLAQRRHEAGMLTDSRDLSRRRISMMLLDYDETIGKTLTPPSEDMMAEITYQLKQQVQIGLISLQPVGQRGLEDTFLAPMRRYLSAHGEPLSLLQQVTPLPSEGVMGYRPREDGTVDEQRPLYNVGFQPHQWEAFVNTIQESPVMGYTRKLFLRGGYASLHFENKQKMTQALQELSIAFQDFTPALELRIKRAEDVKKHVLHIRVKGITKALGRHYMLETVRAQAEERLGREIPRSEILVVGDRMGVSNGENDDAKMFVLGGVNAAVGKECMPGAYADYLDKRQEGTLALLKGLREFSEAKKPKPAISTVSAQAMRSGTDPVNDLASAEMPFMRGEEVSAAVPVHAA